LQNPQEFIALNNTNFTFDVKAFNCKKPDMNQFLLRNAAKHMRQGLSMTWVLPKEHQHNGKKSLIAAYYTLAMGNVGKEDIPKNAGLGSMPRYPAPVAKLARLAISAELQGQGYGEKSLVYAIRHVVKLTSDGAGLSAIGMVLDVLDDDAKGFYDKFDFFSVLADNPMRLFVPMHLCRQI
jgi:GNAT superfamily N-acetyltransferase